jgi:hypothetical protein
MHPAILLIITAVVIFRLIGPLGGSDLTTLLANVSPLAAVMVTGAIYLPRRAAFGVPFGALLLSTVAVNVAKGWPVLDPFTLGAVGAFVLLFILGWCVRGTRRVPVVFGVTIAGTLAFYLLTNTMSFAFEPAYPRGFSGWVQALTVGLPLPGAPPTWAFLLRSLAGDLFFTTLMVLACHPFESRLRRPVQAVVKTS